MPDSANLLPLEFFINPRCPPAPAAVEAKEAEVDHNGAIEDSEGGVADKDRALFHMLASTIL